MNQEEELISPARSRRTLPANYIPAARFDARDRRLIIALNLLGALLFLGWGWFFFSFAAAVRPDDGPFLVAPGNAVGLLALILAPFLVILAHELVHGLFFWIFTRERPVFGLSLTYAYAAAPGWYLPRWQFLIVGLSPLVCLTAAGLLLLPLAPVHLVLSLLVGLTANAAGAVGDLVVAYRLLRLPPSTLAHDLGPAITLYRPASEPLGNLYRIWSDLMVSLSAPDDCPILFQKLVDRYAAPGRHYHNLNHLAHVLAVVADLAPLAADYPAVQLAAWFHDAIYDPRARDNEAQSAALARRALTRHLKLPAARVEKVAALILATANHGLPEREANQADAAVLIDADLAVLGAGAAAYSRYAQAIRREYAHVPDAEYHSARAAVLQGFLDRPRLYLTDAACSAYETQARENLARELAGLTDSPPAR